MKKSVLVTGATSGTGIAIAERFAKEGYDVFITSRDIEKAEKCAKDIADKFKRLKPRMTVLWRLSIPIWAGISVLQEKRQNR